MKKQKWHVYIARGLKTASADFEAETGNEARAKAATLWTEAVSNLDVHAEADCWSHGCDGGSADPLVRFAQVEKSAHATSRACRESARIVRAVAKALAERGHPLIAADARQYARSLSSLAGRLDRREAMRIDGQQRVYDAQYAHAAGYHE